MFHFYDACAVYAARVCLCIEKIEDSKEDIKFVIAKKYHVILKKVEKDEKKEETNEKNDKKSEEMRT